MFLKSKMVALPNTLSFRLTCWYVLMFVLFLLIALMISYFAIDSILNNRMDEDLHEDIEEFRILLAVNGLERVIEEIDREAGSGNSEAVFIRVFDAAGKQIFSSDLNYWQGLQLNSTIFSEVVSSNTQVRIETQTVISQEYDTRIIYALIGPNTVLQIGESMEEKQEIMELILIVFIFMLLLVMPLASGIGWLIARKAVAGIEEVSRAAIDIRNGKFDRRVNVKAHGAEITVLVNTFNAMAERIRNLIAEMREMIDNIAHDLRSPLARIRAISESTLSKNINSQECHMAAASTIEECDRLIKLINTALDVAEADADVAHTLLEQINVSELAEDVCELFEPLAEQKQITLSYDIEADCSMQGHKHNIQRMLANLLDNAMKYTPAQGTVKMQVERQNENNVAISVTDSGVGIPEPDQARIFDRFYRCDQSRSEEGCGLGLSFVRAVAKAHGGQIELTSMPNRGSTFTVLMSA